MVFYMRNYVSKLSNTENNATPVTTVLIFERFFYAFSDVAIRCVRHVLSCLICTQNGVVLFLIGNLCGNFCVGPIMIQNLKQVFKVIRYKIKIIIEEGSEELV